MRERLFTEQFSKPLGGTQLVRNLLFLKASVIPVFELSVNGAKQLDYSRVLIDRRDIFLLANGVDM